MKMQIENTVGKVNAIERLEDKVKDIFSKIELNRKNKCWKEAEGEEPEKRHHEKYLVGGGHEPRCASSLEKLKKAGKWILPWCLQKEGGTANTLILAQ